MPSDDDLPGADPPSKRRKTHADSSPPYSSPGAGAGDRPYGDPSPEPQEPRRLSIRGRQMERRTMSRSRSLSRSRSRSRSRTRSLNGDGDKKYYTERSRSSRSPSRRRVSSQSPSRSPSRFTTRSGSRLRSRSRRRSRSNSDSPSRSMPSRSRSHSRSPSQISSRTDSLSPRALQPTPPREPLKPNYRPRLVLHGHTKPVSQVRISPNGRFIASASADGTLKIWDTVTGTHMDTLVGHMAGVSCLAWTPDSNTLASGSDDKLIRLWDRVTGRPRTTARKSVAGQEMAPLKGHHNYIHCLAFSPKGNILASGSYDEAVFLWDVRAGRLMRSLPAHSDPVSGIDFCQDGTLVVSCSTDGLIRVWDTSTGQCLRTLVHEDNPAVTNVCFSPNGRFVLAFNLDNCIRLWDYVAGSVKKTYQGHINERFAVGGCFGVLDGAAFIASASEDGSIVLWDVKSKELVQRVEGHEGVCFWVDVHKDTMVSAGQDCTVRVYRHVQEGQKQVNGTASEEERENEREEGNLEAGLPIRQEDVKMEDV